jgi:hypothetical protein
VGPAGEAAAVSNRPRRGRGVGSGGRAGPQGQLDREAGAGPTAGRERGGGRLASWATREGEGAAGPKGEEREKKKGFFLFSLNLDEWFSQFQSIKTNAWFGMVQQTKIKYF